MSTQRTLSGCLPYDQNDHPKYPISGLIDLDLSFPTSTGTQIELSCSPLLGFGGHNVLPRLPPDELNLRSLPRDPPHPFCHRHGRRPLRDTCPSTLYVLQQQSGFLARLMRSTKPIPATQGMPMGAAHRWPHALWDKVAHATTRRTRNGSP